VLRSVMRKSLKGLGGFPTLTGGFILGPSVRRCGSAFAVQVSGFRSQENLLALDRREKSREEWEREFTEDQYNILPADGSRVGHIMAKRSTSPAPIRDASHLIALLVSGLLLGFCVVIFQGDNPHKIALGLAALIAGCCLGLATFRWKRTS